MNIDNINKTIDLIKHNQSLAFSMSDYIQNVGDFVTEENECGTACCLAGYGTIAKYGSVDTIEPTSINSEGEPYTDHFEIAAKFFGIDSLTAYNLFIPSSHINETDKDMAIRVLEYLRDTGKVLWNELPSENAIVEDF